MELPTNVYDDNLIKSHRRHTDDVSYVQKDHLKSLSDSLTLSSRNGWAQPSVLTVVPNIHHQNLIPSIPNQNSDPHNWVIDQNHLFPRLLSTEIPSKYPSMGNLSYSNTNAFEEFQNNVTSNLKFPVTYYTSFPVSEGTSYNMHDFQGNTRLEDVSHNQGLFIGSHEPALVHFMVESQQFNVSEPEDINKSITKETSNRRQEEQVIIKTDQKKKKGISIKEQWTPIEDEMLMTLVKRNGTKKWTAIAKMFQGRIGKQCRERWHNHLRPDIKKKSWSEKEDQILVEVHKLVGNKWTEIAKRLPGRSENIVKNHWNATKRRLLSMRNRRSDALPLGNKALENYIWSITINNNVFLMNKGADIVTANAEIEYNKCEHVVDGVNLNLVARRQTATMVMDASTTAVYVPEKTAVTWGNDFARVYEPMDDPCMDAHEWLELANF